MIFDTYENIEKYSSAHHRFVQAFTWLKQVDLTNLPIGKIDILKQDIFVVVLDKEQDQKNKMMESHQKYIDIHYTLEGTDVVGWRSSSNSIAKDKYNPMTDDLLYDQKPSFLINVPPKHFAIFFPEDVHIAMKGKGRVRKLVIKVAV